MLEILKNLWQIGWRKLQYRCRPWMFYGYHQLSPGRSISSKFISNPHIGNCIGIQWNVIVWPGDTAIIGRTNYWGHWLCSQSIGPGFRNKSSGTRKAFFFCQLITSLSDFFLLLVETSWRASRWREVTTLDTNKATRLIEICCWLFSNKLSHIRSSMMLSSLCSILQYAQINSSLRTHFKNLTPIHVLRNSGEWARI